MCIIFHICCRYLIFFFLFLSLNLRTVQFFLRSNMCVTKSTQCIDSGAAAAAAAASAALSLFSPSFLFLEKVIQVANKKYSINFNNAFRLSFVSIARFCIVQLFTAHCRYTYQIFFNNYSAYFHLVCESERLCASLCNSRGWWRWCCGWLISPSWR